MIQSPTFPPESPTLPRERSSLSHEAYASGYTRGHWSTSMGSKTSRDGLKVNGSVNDTIGNKTVVSLSSAHSSQDVEGDVAEKTELKEEYLPNIGRRKPRDILSWSQYLASRQITLIAFICAHQVPALRQQTEKFLYLQYHDRVANTAYIGRDDIYFVVLWIVILTFVRAFLMEFIFAPVAGLAGISKPKSRVRFAEQGWMVSYYVTAFVVGMVLLSRSEYMYSVDHLWIGWPHFQLDPSLKAYYLIQLSCWLSQIYILNVEQRRKDYYQMFAHHIVTCLLVVGSYYYYYTRVGHVILIQADLSDVFLSSAKMLKYLGFQTLCDIMFGVFLLSWIGLRHVLYNYIVWSAWHDSMNLVETKCYYHDGELIRCFKPQVHNTFVGLLLVLQVISLIWLWMMLRVVVKILKGGSAEDNRSDDEGTE